MLSKGRGRPSVESDSMDNAEYRRYVGGWVMFKREMRRLEKERDADPIREARSDAWKKAAQKSGMTFAKLMVIANSA